MKPYIVPFEQLKNKDIELVGGKNASIGEMISALANLGVSVPGGFATTSHAYRDFLAQGGLDERIRSVLAALDVDDVERLAVVGCADPRLDARHPVPEALARGGPGRVAQDGTAERQRRRIRGGGALFGHRRGSARGIVRGDSRRLSSTCAARNT